MDRLLHQVLTYRFGAAMASLYSWHSYRSGLCTALFAAKCPDATNQLICRWMCPESLHVYRRMGTAEHAQWIARAAAADVDVLQSGHAPRISGDDAYASVFRMANGRNRDQRAMMADWAEASAGQAEDGRGAAMTGGPRVATRAHAAAAAAPAIAPLTKDNAVGRRVLIPAEVHPTYACTEQNGAGWEALVMSATSVTAVVRLIGPQRLAADGRRYEDERLPIETLVPLGV